MIFLDILIIAIDNCQDEQVISRRLKALKMEFEAIFRFLAMEM